MFNQLKKNLLKSNTNKNNLKLLVSSSNISSSNNNNVFNTFIYSNFSSLEKLKLDKLISYKDNNNIINSSNSNNSSNINSNNKKLEQNLLALLASKNFRKFEKEIYINNEYHDLLFEVNDTNIDFVLEVFKSLYNNSKHTILIKIYEKIIQKTNLINKIKELNSSPSTNDTNINKNKDIVHKYKEILPYLIISYLKNKNTKASFDLFKQIKDNNIILNLNNIMIFFVDYSKYLYIPKDFESLSKYHDISDKTDKEKTTKKTTKTEKEDDKEVKEKLQEKIDLYLKEFEDKIITIPKENINLIESYIQDNYSKEELKIAKSLKEKYLIKRNNEIIKAVENKNWNKEDKSDDESDNEIESDGVSCKNQ